jgi:hypothetical protein
MLEFNSDWRFDSPGQISNKTYSGFRELMNPIITPNPKFVYEHFKGFFAAATGSTSSSSSSTSWAETDMERYMVDATGNAALFIEAFYDACESLPPGHPNPGVMRINRVLSETGSGWMIQLPSLVRTTENESVPQQNVPQHLETNARDIIHKSLSESQRLLAEGHYRLAVQEIVWLLETVSTVFAGIETDEGTVEGKYFNTIVKDLRRLEKGRTLEQTLNWISTLHGFLSSPSGGGIRHGTTLDGTNSEVEPNEARLYCNLIRSYIFYLLAEHRRLTGS